MGKNHVISVGKLAGYHAPMEGPKRFTVIEGGNSPLPGTRRRRKADAVMLLCRICEADTGVASSTWIPAVMGLMERAGRPEGGTKGHICAHCLARGKVTPAM